MSKKKDEEVVEVVKEEKSSDMVDAMLKKLVGVDAKIGSEAIGTLYGVPLPYFTLRYLFTSNVLPCGNSFLLAGQSGTGKTSFAMYLSRLMISNGGRNDGYAVGVHTEDKWPDSLVSGILRELLARFAAKSATNSLQDWYAFVQDMLHSKLRKEDGGDRIPMAIFVDSLLGSQGEETMKKSLAEGGAGRGFSELALFLSKNLPILDKEISATSASIFYISHLKVGQEGELYTPGGTAKDFFSSYQFHMTKIGSGQKNDAVNVGATHFSIKCAKNSYAPSQQYARVSMEWSYDDNGQPMFRYNWPEVATNYLWFLANDPKSSIGARHPLMHLIGDIERVNSGGYKYSSKSLGAKGLNDREFGEAIEQNEAYRTELDKQFHIPRRMTVNEYFAKVDAEAAAREKAKRTGRRG